MKTQQVIGHEAARDDLLRALRSGRLPQVLLITGDAGIGKQTLGRWLAQAILCDSPNQAPCGACQGCRLVSDLSHPDFHWFIPIPRPKATDGDKQVEEAADSIAAAVAARRATPVYAPPTGLENHGVASARLLLKIGAMTTVMAKRRVFLVGEADRLVPQEANPEAANALLKFLEEPPASATILLTTTDVGRVLPTIRSRAVPIRLGRLSEDQVEAGLALLAPSLDQTERRRRAGVAEGSLGKALHHKASTQTDAAVEQLLSTIKQGGVGRFERVLGQGTFQARGDFADLLDGLTATLSAAARAELGGAGRSIPAILQDVAPATRFLDALDRVAAAREAAQGNINPQLVLATVTAELAEALWR